MFVFIPLIISQLASWRCPRARIYIGGSGIVEVIEKLSCRSGWFVESGQALIHPAASPHKNIKQGIPEERRQRQEWWGETERQSEAERERGTGHIRHVNSKEQGLKMGLGTEYREKSSLEKSDTSGTSPNNTTISALHTLGHIIHLCQ